ncbi:golgin subfamily A member 6-like protein 1 [Macrosteles quadrilineatus]|uniref:golgin subfamily A member 6-like protein 1 n=1 Tax=Macrosteles quadrilineatus TaxID=74068 RepID=UPI0023E16208|nr:golgin subfamily A member 6-like protein 1 [Macrosteles quadrilineatus]
MVVSSFLTSLWDCIQCCSVSKLLSSVEKTTRTLENRPIKNMAPRKKQSDSERLKKKREAEKKRQEKIKQDPERLRQQQIKEHEKYLKKLQKGQRKLIADQSDREKRQTKKKWRDATNKSRQKKKQIEEEERILNENSPPPSEHGSPGPAEPPRPDGRINSGRKRIKRNKTKCYRELQELKLKYKKSTKKAERYKKRYLRLLKSKDKEKNTVSTPRTKIFVGLQSSSWNFSEAGHGKGAPDGVGGFIKRTADKCIAQGSDIMNITALLAMLKEKCRKIVVWRINQEEITSIEQMIEEAGVLSTVPGTFLIHQVSCSKEKVDYRTMTCWKCEPGVRCEHYSLDIKKNEQQCEQQNKPIEKALDVGDWVVVTYDSTNYPGEIVSVQEEDMTINAMHPSGPGGWKWPPKPDVHTYPKQDLVRRIDPPVPSGSRADQFIFKDLI